MEIDNRMGGSSRFHFIVILRAFSSIIFVVRLFSDGGGATAVSPVTEPCDAPSTVVAVGAGVVSRNMEDRSGTGRGTGRVTGGGTEAGNDRGTDGVTDDGYVAPQTRLGRERSHRRRSGGRGGPSGAGLQEYGGPPGTGRVTGGGTEAGTTEAPTE